MKWVKIHVVHSCGHSDTTVCNEIEAQDIMKKESKSMCIKCMIKEIQELKSNLINKNKGVTNVNT